MNRVEEMRLRQRRQAYELDAHRCSLARGVAWGAVLGAAVWTGVLVAVWAVLPL